MRQLNLPEGTVVLPEEAVLEPLSFTLDSLDTYFTLALDNRPEMAQARAGIAARSALVDVAKSNYYPNFLPALAQISPMPRVDSGNRPPMLAIHLEVEACR